jgi:myo-inositol-1(or 4)-monophosphatase
MADWHSILHKLSDKIQGNVLSVIHQRNSIPVQRFKDLLDLQAQDTILETLSKLDVGITLVSEEGDQIFGDGRFTMVADPVDGTTNLARGLSPAVTSISVSETDHQSGAVAGIVTNFFTGETFYAEKGVGATLDGDIINVAPHIKYHNGVIGMDISKNPTMERLGRLIGKSRHVRQQGCSAMSLCSVAAGKLDAHIDLSGIVRATDISAGLLMIREAGGVYAVNGELLGDMALTQGTRVDLVAASNQRLLEEIESIMG